MASEETREAGPAGSYLLDSEKNALRVHGLSAAELLDRELHERGLAIEKSWNERTQDGMHLLSHWWNKARGLDSKDAYYQHLKSQFSGGKGYTFRHRYQKPLRELSERDVEQWASSYHVTDKHAKRPFLDPFGRKIWKYEDVDVYMSPSSSTPRRLIAMASKGALQEKSSTWRRTQIRGSVPLALRMAEWALSPRIGRVQSVIRAMLVALPLQALLAMPGANAPWEMNDLDENYTAYSDYHWKWPKHAINPLDARQPGHNDANRDDAHRPELASSKRRLLQPRRLVVFENGNWVSVDDPPRNLPYVFISYQWSSFENLPIGPGGLDRVDQMAQHLVRAAGLRAYFRDWHCVAKPEEGREQRTSDVNRMCDVIRGSQFVAILLPGAEPHWKSSWGERLWTLPEGMLAPRDIQVYTYCDRSCPYTSRTVTKIGLTAEFWNDNRLGEDVPVRALAEHYDGIVILGRLELFSSAIAALSQRKTNQYTGADLGYALMGLLHYRIDPDATDDLFQVVARLSLANDSDRLIERCISLFPAEETPERPPDELFRVLATRDQYKSHLWDITPRCEVVGVGDEPSTVILNECRAIPIQWRVFPRIRYRRRQLLGIRKKFAEFVIRSGAWWVITAYSLAFTYAPILIGFKPHTIFFSTFWLWYTVLLFLGVGLLLSAFAPRAVRQLFGGEVEQSAPHLVAFEGTMRRTDLECIIFGSDRNRLHYEPSSTPFAADARNKYIRKANEPEWVAASQRKPTLPGHRIFTLVDTGNLSISIFQAKRPPTVALITGSEGGMLRAVLCSWRFSNDCHYRETVIRVPSSTWYQTRPAAWIKVSLQSQADFLAEESRPRFGPPGDVPVKPKGRFTSTHFQASTANTARVHFNPKLSHTKNVVKAVVGEKVKQDRLKKRRPSPERPPPGIDMSPIFAPDNHQPPSFSREAPEVQTPWQPAPAPIHEEPSWTVYPDHSPRSTATASPRTALQPPPMQGSPQPGSTPSYSHPTTAPTYSRPVQSQSPAVNSQAFPPAHTPSIHVAAVPSELRDARNWRRTSTPQPIDLSQPKKAFISSQQYPEVHSPQGSGARGRHSPLTLGQTADQSSTARPLVRVYQPSASQIHSRSNSVPQYNKPVPALPIEAPTDNLISRQRQFDQLDG